MSWGTLQAVTERLQAKFPKTHANTVPAAKATEPPKPTLEEQLAKDEPVQNPVVIELETLPDAELQKVAISKGVKIDGRWSRARLISETVAAMANPPAPVAVPVPTTIEKSLCVGYVNTTPKSLPVGLENRTLPPAPPAAS